MIRKSLVFLSILAAVLACRILNEPDEPQATAPTVTSTYPIQKSPTPQPITPTPVTVQVDASLDLDELLPSSPITVYFNQRMDPESGTPALLIYPWMDGEVSWDDSYSSMTFKPSKGLTPERSYLIFLNQDLKSASGQSFASPPEWEIKVQAAPRITGRKPAHTQLEERLPTILLTFDREMDGESVAEALTILPFVPFDLEWEETILNIQLLEPLNPGTRYNFTLAGEASDTNDIPLGNDYRWDYSLAGLLKALSGPTIDSPQNAIALEFNYPIDMMSLEQAVSVSTGTGLVVPGEWTWSDENRANFRPTAPFRSSTVYTLNFTAGLQDANGDEFPPLDPLTYKTPPPIISILPRQDDVADPDTEIRIIFSQPVDQEKTAAAFRLDPSVPGDYKWDQNTMIFMPEGLLASDTQYTARLDTSAVDIDGNPILIEPFTWSFITPYNYEWYPDASFGESGPNAQVLDVNGERAIQFTASKDLSEATFELYRLTLEQFLDRYSSGFKGIAGRENVPISTEGASLVKSWQVPIQGEGGGWSGSIYEVTIPDDVDPGLYILNLETNQNTDQLILVLTRNSIVVKQAGGQLVAWVTDINGGNKPGVRVSVYARDGQLLSQGRADGNGVYETLVSRDPQPLIIVAHDSKKITGSDIEGTDITVSGLSNEWDSSYSGWWNWWRRAPKSQDYVAYIYTDRPIYRPGQTIFFKAIVRQDDDAVLNLLPEGASVMARIRDARGNVVQTFELASNDFGTVNGEFQLAEGAMLGDYDVEVILEGESHRQKFKVQDYRKPDYQVTVTTDQEQYVAGDPIQVYIDTQYFFGEPVANASLTIRRYELGQYYTYYWSDDDSDPPEYIWYGSYGDEVTGKTDLNGNFTQQLTAEMGFSSENYYGWSSLQKRTWGIEVTVDDGSHQTVSSFVVVEVFNAAEKISIDAGKTIKEPGQPFTVQGSVTTLTGEGVSSRALRLELRQYVRETSSYANIIQFIDLTSDENGQISVHFTIDRSGYYQLRLSGTDSRGNQIYTRRWIYAISKRDTWASDYVEKLRISADRDSYAPGELAQLVIESTISGPAMLTFERGTTRRLQPIQLTPPLTLVDVPILAGDGPNIFVTVNAWEKQDTSLVKEMEFSLSDSRLRTASVELKVPVTGKSLKVTITPDKESYTPRQEATFTVRVTDEQGQPVYAEVSLALVDEAIFSLSEELSGPIFDAFYFDRKNIVRTYDSMSLQRTLFGLGLGGGGGDFAGNPRSDFPDTAAWFPEIYTDANGEASLSLALPDSLTRWRITAKAITTDHRVGETYTNIFTQQEIVVRPILPRGLTSGDQVQLSAIVHNYSATQQDLEVAMLAAPADPTSDDAPLLIDEPIIQSVSLAPGEVRIVRWTANAVGAGEAAITVRAYPGPQSGEEPGSSQIGDAVRLTLPIRPLAIPDVTNLVGEFEEEFNTTLVIPDGVLGISTVKIELSRSIAGSLLTGLEFLTGYPYGCVEQTMSRALPNAVVGRAFHQLGVGNPTLQADLPPKIYAGLQRLYGYQHNDGGWGWWFDDQTNDYQTAWVVFGLAVTADAGYEVDPQVIARGADWLKDHLEDMDIRTRAYALYSLAIAGHGDIESTRAMTERLIELDTFSQAGLALALHELGSSAEASAIVDVLTESAVQRDGMVYWPNPHEDGHYYAKTMASSLRSTALALDAFVHIRPDHSLEPGIVRWLMSQRRQDGWGSTNETSFAILALTDHLLTVEAATTDTGYSIDLNGNIVDSGTLGRNQPAVSLEIPVSQMSSGANLLNIQQSGQGRLYYIIHSRMLFSQAQIEAAGGVSVKRLYQDPETQKEIDKVIPGQLVKVTLTVDLPDNGFFIIVEDKLPGGLEALNESLNITSHEQTLYDQEPHYYWQEYGYNNKEVFGDRVTFFISEMDAGARTFSYLARVTHTGTFVAMPAEVYAMYDLTVWGRSDSTILTVGENTSP